jgi:hypothetical protein
MPLSVRTPQEAAPVWDLTPVHRPLWWAALALLLVNDNLLKGGGVAPGWLTGKLSDFAFLIVAPVLLAALLPRVVPRRRALAMGAVVLVYAAADLSPTVSDAIVAAAQVVGLPWRLWPDVTDLMALAVLPVTWRLLRPAAPATSPTGRSRPLLESAGVFAGAFACLATSAPDQYVHAPYVVNQTAQPREITATWLLRPAPCEGDLTAFAAGLTPSDLDDPHGATLASGEVAVLDRAPLPGQPLHRVCPSQSPDRGFGYGYGACTGVIVQASPDLAVLAVYPLGWGESDGDFISCSNDSPATKCKAQFGLRDNPGPDSLSLRERDGKLAFTIGNASRLRVAVISPAAVAARPPNPQGCRPLLAEQGRLPGVGGACSVDAECKSAPALPVPGRACVIYGNQSLTAAATTSLRQKWTQQGCIVDPQNSEYSCPPAQPAACVDARCQQLCPGVPLPACPYRCSTPPPPRTGCYPGPTCSNDQGEWCTCVDSKFTCAPPVKPAGCPIACVPRSDSSAPPPRDADVAADAQVDSGQ